MNLPISEIIVDPRVQLKARKIDNDTVTSYVEAMSNGDQFPPVIVFSQNGNSWLADGFHRVAAARFLGRQEIEVENRPGTKEDAMIYAATANARHGRQMSRAEKKEAAERLLKTNRPEWTCQTIAGELGLGERTVKGYSASLNKHDGDGKKVQDCTLPSTPSTLFLGDFRNIDIDPESIDVMITDPPYPREYLPLYEALAERAATWLKPGGSLAVMVGQSYLPEIFEMMTPYLNYQWVVAYTTPGGQSAQLWQRKVNTFWKPVLWFVKGEYLGKWLGDVARSAVNDNDKRFHDWGQSESGMADLIERFSEPGDLVLDPCCGAGTTGVVAMTLNRRFIGIDIDAENIRKSETRIQSLVNES